MSNDGLDAVRAEALSESRQVTWRDQRFDVAPLNDWILQFQHYADREKITLALEVALGAEQYQRFIFADPPPTTNDALALSNSIVSAFGITPGN